MNEDEEEVMVTRVTEKIIAELGLPWSQEAAIKAGMTDDEIKAACKKLMAQRKTALSEEIMLEVMIDNYKSFLCRELTWNLSSKASIC